MKISTVNLRHKSQFFNTTRQLAAHSSNRNVLTSRGRYTYLPSIRDRYIVGFDFLIVPPYRFLFVFWKKKCNTCEIWAAANSHRLIRNTAVLVTQGTLWIKMKPKVLYLNWGTKIFIISLSPICIRPVSNFLLNSISISMIYWYLV